MLACLVLAAGIAACEPTTNVDPTSTQDAVLPATESSKDFGEYVLYFNALLTDQLSPDIASEYGIVRSKSRALLNVSVHRKLDNGLSEAVTGAVSASAINLNGQLKTMALREVREETAIYYIGELAVTDLYDRGHAQQRSQPRLHGAVQEAIFRRRVILRFGVIAAAPDCGSG
jgi:hypothetical protein